jgi:hypothetical protein
MAKIQFRNDANAVTGEIVFTETQKTLIRDALPGDAGFKDWVQKQIVGLVKQAEISMLNRAFETMPAHDKDTVISDYKNDPSYEDKETRG